MRIFDTLVATSSGHTTDGFCQTNTVQPRGLLLVTKKVILRPTIPSARYTDARKRATAGPTTFQALQLRMKTTDYGGQRQRAYYTPQRR